MGIHAIEDLFRVERALLRHPTGLALAELHRQTGIPKSTLLRILGTMAEWNRAEQMPDGTWRPTAAWVLMHMQAIAHTIGEIAHAETQSEASAA